MTEKLKSLMHERAELTEFELPDVELLIRHGAQRARRRRLAQVGGGAAATTAAVVVAAAALSGGPAGDSGPAVATDPLSVEQPSYAKGTVIHDADGAVEVGHRVRAYVRTSAGYAFIDLDGVVRTVVDGVVTKVGQRSATQARLFGDADGSLVAWISPDEPAVVVADLTTGETFDLHRSVDLGAGDEQRGSVALYAVDGRTVYLRDVRGAVSVDVDTGETTVQDPGAGTWPEIVAAEDGQVAFSDDEGIEVRTPGREPMLLEGGFGDTAAFSPDGRWITVDADEPRVYDARTGDLVLFDIDDDFATGYEWLDDHTLVMIAAKTPTSTMRLITCQVPDGTCAEAATLGAPEHVEADIALPVGMPITG